VPVAQLLPQGEEGQLAGVLALFAAASMLKMLQGSSMATFAAPGPLVAPVVAHLGLPPALAVHAICAGGFVAILPNDNDYWLVRRDALEGAPEKAVVARLTGAAVCQGLAALGSLLALWALGAIG
jgi:GntP family gluconate:H+ symporter